MVFEDQYNNGTLGVAAGLAQGAANFMTAYRGSQQQAFQNKMMEEEMAAKRQLYQLQAQKLQKEIQPVQINLEKVKAAREYFGDESSFYKRAVNEALDSVQTPAQAKYLSSIAAKNPGGGTGGMALYTADGGMTQPSTGQEPAAPTEGQTASPRQMFDTSYRPKAPQLNKEEAEMYMKMLGNESSMNYKEAMLGQRGREMEAKNYATQRDLDIKTGDLSRREFEAQTKAEQGKMKAEYDRDRLAQEARLRQAENELKAMQARFDEQFKTRKASTDEKNASTTESRAKEEERKNKAQEALDAEKLKIEREKIKAANQRAAQRKAGSKEAMDKQALNSRIADIYKTLDKVRTRTPGLMEDEGERESQMAKVRADLDPLLDQWKATYGAAHSLDLRAPNRPVGGGKSGGGYFGDGRVGPVAPGGGGQAATGGKVRVKNLQTGQTGNWDLSKGRPDPSKYQVLE